MSKECNVCQGKWQVASNPYRKTISKEEPKKNRMKNTIKNRLEQLKNWIGSWDLFAVAIIIGACIIIPTLISFIYSSDVKRDMGGYLVVQYASDGSLARCWIQNYGSQINFTGTTTSTWIDNKEHLKASSTTMALGITDVSKCNLIK